MDNFNRNMDRSVSSCCLTPITALIGVGLAVTSIVLWLNNSVSRQFIFGALFVSFLFLLTTYLLYRKTKAGFQRDVSDAKVILSSMMDGNSRGPMAQDLTLVPKAAFSDRLRFYLQEIESRANRPIRIFDRRAKDAILKSQEMPNAGPPPFYLGQNYSKSIDIFITPGEFSKEEAESVIASLATQAMLHFEGIPFVRFNPFAQFTSRGTYSSLGTDVDPIQRWVSTGLLNQIADMLIFEKGFSRTTSYETSIKIQELLASGRPGYSLSTIHGTKIINAFNLGTILLHSQEKTLSEELIARIQRLEEKLAAENPEDLFEARRIVTVCNENNWKNPRNYKACLLAILRIWSIDHFVGFGQLDRATGMIKDELVGWISP